jgi:hypothetical protein
MTRRSFRALSLMGLLAGGTLPLLMQRGMRAQDGASPPRAPKNYHRRSRYTGADLRVIRSVAQERECARRLARGDYQRQQLVAAQRAAQGFPA